MNERRKRSMEIVASILTLTRPGLAAQMLGGRHALTADDVVVDGVLADLYAEMAAQPIIMADVVSAFLGMAVGLETIVAQLTGDRMGDILGEMARRMGGIAAGTIDAACDECGKNHWEDPTDD